MIETQAVLLWNQSLGGGYHKMGFKTPLQYRQAAPGQFVMIRTSRQTFPLLRRPFSIHRRITADDQEGIEILYKVVGKGTRSMTQLVADEKIGVLGPLGTGFALPDSAQRIYLAAGGIGVAPMVFLAEVLRKRLGFDVDCRIFLGGRSESDLLCRQEFEHLQFTVHLTTDDGSTGQMCLLTDPLEDAVRQAPPDIIFACGPTAMLTCVAGLAEQHHIPCQVSIETMMACGMGACLGCAVVDKTNPDTYLHACLNGPVFDTSRIEI